jgi:transposase-like protein
MEPTTLQEAVIYFADPANCREYLVPRRWSNSIVICPTCGSEKVTFQAKHNRWQCAVHHPKRAFTLKTGTIMEDSPLGLDKWLPAMWLIASNRNGVSSWELHRAIGVTQKTAWFMLHRIRLAMQDDSDAKLSGVVESDETYMGGKAANMHLDKLTRLKMKGHVRAGTEGKAIVMGLLERHGKAKTKVLPNVRSYHIRSTVIQHVEKGSTVYTDSLRSYRNLPVDGFAHDFVDHTEQYVKGAVHTNGLENFWSLLKRTIKGTYVSVEPFHLQAYCDEQAFRFNNRLPMRDADRFSFLVRKCAGKRLTYAELTGKTDAGPCLEEEPF